MMFNTVKALLSLVAFGMIANAATIPTLNEKECKATYNTIKKCVLLVDEENSGRHACEVYETKECQQLFNNIDDELNKCEFKEDVPTAEFVRSFAQKSKTYCIKDEDGQYCPLASIVTGRDFSIYDIDENKSDVAILSDIYSLNCVSEKCRQAAIDYIDTNRKQIREIYLKSDKPDSSVVKSMNNLESIMNNLLTNDCKNGKTLTTIKKEYTTPAVASTKSKKARKCIVIKHNN